MPIRSGLKTLSLLLICSFVFVFVSKTFADEPEFTAITTDNATQLQILTTIENFRDTKSYCGCDVRFFSQNGRSIATDWTVTDLVTGITINLKDRGFPIALSPDGTQVMVSGQDTGTRILDIITGVEEIIMIDDAEDATYSPDGDLIALSSRDADAVQVWQVSDLSLIATLGRSKPYADTESLQFTPDGKFLIWSDFASNLHLWDTQEQTDVWQIANDVWDYHLLPDEKTLVLSKFDFETVEVWDISTRQNLGRIVDSGIQSGVDAYEVSPDRKTLAINFFGGNDRLELWNIGVNPAKKIAELDDRDGYGLNFTPDSQYLIFSGDSKEDSCDRESTSCSGGRGGYSENFRMIDVTSGEVVNTITPSDGSSIGNTEFIADKNLLISSGSYWGREIYLWRLDETDITLIATYPGLGFLLSPDGSSLLVALNNDLLAVYGIPTDTRPIQDYIMQGTIVPSSINVRSEPSIDGEVVGVVGDVVRILGRNPASDYVYLPDFDGWIRSESTYVKLVLDLPISSLNVIDPEMIPLTTESPTATVTPAPTATVQPVISVPVSLDELQLSLADPIIEPPQSPVNSPRITPQNADEVSLLAILPQSSIRGNSLPMVVPSISRDGTGLITPPTGKEHYPRIWDLQSFEYQNGPDFGEPTYSLVMAGSPDGNTIAFTPSEFYQPLQLWSQDSKRFKSLFKILSFYKVSLVFSPDGNSLAHSEGVYDIIEGRNRFTIETSGSLTFSPDSQRLAVIERERVYIYDAESGKQLARTERVDSRSDLTTGKFSPDGTVLAVRVRFI